MERLLALLFFLLLSRLAAGAILPEDCGKELAHLVGRMPLRRHVVLEQLRARVSDPLIIEFEVEHLEYLWRGTGHTSKSWKVFNPIWIFDDAHLKERLLDYFDPSDGSSPRYPEGIEKWLITWEKLYETHLGRLSYVWTKDRNLGRRKFIQRFLLESAVRFAIREGGGSQPGYFSTDPSRPLYVQILTAEIERFFPGGLNSFQRSFDILYRQTVRSRVETREYPTFEKNLREALRAVGVDVGSIRNWQPRVRADYRKRRNQEDIQLAAQSIQAFGNTRLPLAGLFLHGSEGAADSQNTSLWSQAFEITERHGGIERFFSKVNRQLEAMGLDPLVPGMGTRSLAQELVVELAIFQLTQREHVQNFPGFQAEKANEPFFLDMDNVFVRASRLTLFRLNQIVLDRIRR